MTGTGNLSTSTNDWRTLLHRRRQTLRVHSPGGSTLLCVLTSWPLFWKCDVKSKIPLRQSMRIYSKNIHEKFHPDPIWNDRTLGFFKEATPTRTTTTQTHNNNNNNKIRSDMRSVPDLIVWSEARKRVYSTINDILCVTAIPNTSERCYFLCRQLVRILLSARNSNGCDREKLVFLRIDLGKSAASLHLWGAARTKRFGFVRRATDGDGGGERSGGTEAASISAAVATQTPWLLLVASSGAECLVPIDGKPSTGWPWPGCRTQTTTAISVPNQYNIRYYGAILLHIDYAAACWRFWKMLEDR